MQMNDMIMISVDDHIIEPPDMFKGREPAKFRGRFPKFITEANGVSAWTFEGRIVRNACLNAVAGRDPTEYGLEPDSLDLIRPGCYNVDKRIEDMNANGVLASLNFATWIGYPGKVFYETADKEVAYAALQAYNDWHIDDWCDKYPGRFIPLGIVPLWDVELCVKEVRRLKAKGCSAIALIPNSAKAGFPSIHQPHWDPLWAVMDELQVIGCMHISDNTRNIPSVDSPVDVWLTGAPVSMFVIASDILFSPVLRKYKNIRFALSEGGAGWVPHFLERADQVYQRHRQWTNQNFGGKLPSEVFKEHIYTCVIDDRIAVEQRETVGIDRLMWESDYPHSDSYWPRAPESLWERVSTLPKEHIDKISHLNAMQAFSFDPFKHRPREQSTVGALRKLATHVDVGHLPPMSNSDAYLRVQATDSKQIIRIGDYEAMFNRDTDTPLAAR